MDCRQTLGLTQSGHPIRNTQHGAVVVSPHWKGVMGRSCCIVGNVGFAAAGVKARLLKLEYETTVLKLAFHKVIQELIHFHFPFFILFIFQSLHKQNVTI